MPLPRSQSHHSALAPLGKANNNATNVPREYIQSKLKLLSPKTSGQFSISNRSRTHLEPLSANARQQHAETASCPDSPSHSSTNSAVAASGHSSHNNSPLLTPLPGLYKSPIAIGRKIQKPNHSDSEANQNTTTTNVNSHTGSISVVSLSSTSSSSSTTSSSSTATGSDSPTFLPALALTHRDSPIRQALTINTARRRADTEKYTSAASPRAVHTSPAGDAQEEKVDESTHTDTPTATSSTAIDDEHEDQNEFIEQPSMLKTSSPFPRKSHFLKRVSVIMAADDDNDGEPNVTTTDSVDADVGSQTQIEISTIPNFQRTKTITRSKEVIRETTPRPTADDSAAENPSQQQQQQQQQISATNYIDPWEQDEPTVSDEMEPSAPSVVTVNGDDDVHGDYPLSPQSAADVMKKYNSNIHTHLPETHTPPIINQQPPPPTQFITTAAATPTIAAVTSPALSSYPSFAPHNPQMNYHSAQGTPLLAPASPYLPYTGLPPPSMPPAIAAPPYYPGMSVMPSLPMNGMPMTHPSAHPMHPMMPYMSHLDPNAALMQQQQQQQHHQQQMMMQYQQPAAYHPMAQPIPPYPTYPQNAYHPTDPSLHVPQAHLMQHQQQQQQQQWSLTQKNEIFMHIRNNRHQAVQEALSNGIPVNLTDRFGNQLLHAACQNGNKRIVKILLRWGADINAQNYYGNTPLHFCFAYHYDPLAAYLMSKNANDQILNYFGNSCYDGILRPENREEAIQALYREKDRLPLGVTMDMIISTLT